MVRALDRSRPFGEVRGAPGVAFVQDARLFDHLGHEIVPVHRPTWNEMIHNPELAQQELTLRAATNTVRELSGLSHAEVKRIAQDEYSLHTGRAGKDELIQKIHRRIMEQA
ncbi:MAG: hypothetical protein HW380_204 [Magnetococcales bacterium]|nr:hypothetical protein [Magnetococcales bacterium]HIJ84223.1 hypothetical protein [Magnetococcales bacterium]